MLKSILVTLDDSKSSQEAQSIAIELAKKFKIKVTGVAVLDIPWITAAQPEPLGGGAYKLHRDDEVIRQSHEHVETSLLEFKSRCEKEDIPCEVIEVEGFPATEIERLSQEHDLILMGKTTDFHFEVEDETDLTVQHITRDNPRPLLVVPPKKVHSDKVLIAYDGSLQAARSLHMFLLLGLARGKSVHIISIARTAAQANPIVEHAQKMCANHGVESTATGIVTNDNAEDVILRTAQTLKPGIIVMGAFGHQGFREFFFGSCTEHMIKKTNIPLFVHH